MRNPHVIRACDANHPTGTRPGESPMHPSTVRLFLTLPAAPTGGGRARPHWCRLPRAIRLARALPLLVTAACTPATHQGPGTMTAEHQRRLLGEVCAPRASQASRFTFESSFWLNLHNVLFRDAKRSRGIRDDARSALAAEGLEPRPARAMTTGEGERWDRAVAYYADVILAGPHPDSVVIRVNNRLATSDSAPTVDGELFDGRLREVLADVAPVYRSVWWPGHDARNRSWIREMREQLDRYEACLAPRLAEQLGTGWPERPIRVDATVYASWFGAYTTLDPPHITISTTSAGSQGASGLESLLHEAGHAMLRTVESALAAEARRQGVGPPPELPHLLLFFTAGDLVWRAIPGHPTNAVEFGVWEQNGRARTLRAAIRREWRPWLDGQRDMSEALSLLLRRIARRDRSTADRQN